VYTTFHQENKVIAQVSFVNEAPGLQFKILNSVTTIA
jgi:hypothetical protein